MSTIGWDQSAPGWLESMGDSGDATRQFVMDAPMVGALLDAGLILRRFEDPPSTSPDQGFNDRYTRMPWAFFMVWDKPGGRHDHHLS